jgi:DNA/RNA-binding domain of Phe-tRNA-synthetase-like protein
MNIVIDADVGHEAEPFLLAWSLRASDAGDGPALRRALEAACGAAASGAAPEVEAAVERYRGELVKLGRNPNRYRISSDALLRRCRRDGAVPSISALVDLNNVISLQTGWPVGCYDRGRIEGDVRLRLGREGESMETLGKGQFDIARLPVLCDSVGPFGSTVSDSVRTAVTGATDAALLVVYGYGASEGLAERIAQCLAEAGVRLAEPPQLVAAQPAL